jgi:hypothetical protein
MASLSRTEDLQQNQKRFRKKKTTPVPMELAMSMHQGLRKLVGNIR